MLQATVSEDAVTLNKSALTDAVSQRLNIPKKEAKLFVEAIFETIQTTLIEGEEVKITHFGKFSVRDKHARSGRNPQTGEAIVVAARKVVTFKPSQHLRESISQA